MSFDANLASALKELYFAVNAVWRLGRNMVVAWTYSENVIYLCVVPTYKVFEIGGDVRQAFSKSRLMEEDDFLEICKVFGARPTKLVLDVTVGKSSNQFSPATIDRVLRRYAVTRTPFRSVMLFDIVGFSKAEPIQQVAQLNSLEYSINSADKRLQGLGLDVELARSTVGDGFYVWNRRRGLEADLRTYLAMLFILIDNKRARDKGMSGFVPTLRAVISLGSHYSYHQVEGQSPRGFEYIVGDITITLARLIGKADDHQLILGDIKRPLDRNTKQLLDTPQFLARAHGILDHAEGLEFGGEPVRSIRSFITGTDLSGGGTNVTKHVIVDKHGFNHFGFNVRVEVALQNGEMFEVGIKPNAFIEFPEETTQHPIEVTDLAKVQHLFRG